MKWHTEDSYVSYDGRIHYKVRGWVREDGKGRTPLPLEVYDNPYFKGRLGLFIRCDTSLYDNAHRGFKDIFVPYNEESKIISIISVRPKRYLQELKFKITGLCVDS